MVLCHILAKYLVNYFYKATVQHFSNYGMGIPPPLKDLKKWLNLQY